MLYGINSKFEVCDKDYDNFTIEGTNTEFMV